MPPTGPTSQCPKTILNFSSLKRIKIKKKNPKIIFNGKKIKSLKRELKKVRNAAALGG